MGTVLGILAFVAVVAVFMGLTALKDKAVDSAVGAVNRKVQGRTHQEGLSMARQQYFYDIDAGDEEIVEALVRGVKAAAGPPAAVAATYVETTSPQQVRWSHGTRLHTSFSTVAMVVTANLEDGTEQRGVVLTFPDVSTADGVVADVSAMRALKHDVLAALRGLRPTVEETELAWG